MKYIFIIGLIFYQASHVIAFTLADASLAFPTRGHTIYHVKPASVDGYSRSLITAAYDGYVLCFSQAGAFQWEIQPGTGFPFDLAVGDIDNDSFDETLVASSDGFLYAIDHNGQLLWKFATKAPLYQAAVVKKRDGTSVILTGGVERVLYALSPLGKVLGTFEANGVIRLIGKKNIETAGTGYVAVATARSGLSGNYTLRLHNLDNLKPLWERQMGADKANNERFYSIGFADMDGDDDEEMVFGMTQDKSDEITVFDTQGNLKIVRTCSVRQRPYKMNFLVPVKSPSLGDAFFVNLSGNHLMVFDFKGNCIHTLKGPYAFAGISFDPVTNTLWFGSEISGGDGVYCLRLDQPGWQQAFTSFKPVGTLAKLEQNMSLLLKQAEDFNPPSYQPVPSSPLVTVGDTPEEVKTRYTEPYQMKHVNFASYYRFTEYYDPGIADPQMRAQWERFHSGKTTSHGEIVDFAREREAKGENFFIFAGHGRPFGIDFYVSPATIRKIVEVAPRTLQGFVFAEFESTDSIMARAIREQLIPMADFCYEHGKKKILIRCKNIFWNASIYLDTFQPLMSADKYREIFVPCMEETNSRNQSLSLAGRTGLWVTGGFKNTSGRAVTDNANYNRLWEWGQTQHLSHFVRAMSLNRMLGADYFQINVYTDNEPEMIPFYLMLEKGILPLPKPEDILSLSEVTVGMKDPDEDFLHHGANGHAMSEYSADAPEYVFDKLDCYWGGALIPEYDFEYYAMNARRRMTNFLAQSPYGNLTTVSAATDLQKFPQLKKMFITDGRWWYDDQGKPHTAGEYKPVVLKALEAAAQKLPVKVEGEVSWVAVRIDPKHIRLLLIDPGYLDPADRKAVVRFQNLKVAEARDILSGATLPVKGQTMEAEVPMGILRIIDITHY